MEEKSFNIQDLQEEEILKQESNQNNLFDLNNSMMPPSNSTIPKQSQFTDNITTKKDLEAINEDIYPYPDKDEIPEIKIKDEDEEKFENNIQRFDDSKFNKCINCNLNPNSVFCISCQHNFCDICSRGCQNNASHKLINLAIMKEDSKKDISKIKNLFSKYFIVQKIKLKNPNEKKEINYDINYDISMHEDNPFDGTLNLPDTNDIKLIDKIRKKSYNNYFHYKNIKECYDYMFNRYDDSFDNNCLKIQYIIKNCKGKKITIFGKTFVKNNKNKLSLIINNKKSELVEKTYANENYLEVILVQKSDDDDEDNKYIKDLSCMFNSCNFNYITINEVKGRKKIDLSQVSDISYMFANCLELKEIDIDFFKDMYKIKKMDSLFSGCEKLTNISNIAELNTSKIISMKRIFNDCKKLENLNISTFETGNVKYFEEMFKNCSSLMRLPSIIDFDMKNAESLEGMFKDCSNLNSLPDISGWDLRNVKNMKEMFSGCENLREFPYFDGKEFTNLEKMDKMFYSCSSLKNSKKLPNINTWILGSFEKVTKDEIFGGKEISIFEIMNDFNKILFPILVLYILFLCIKLSLQ